MCLCNSAYIGMHQISEPSLHFHPRCHASLRWAVSATPAPPPKSPSVDLWHLISNDSVAPAQKARTAAGWRYLACHVVALCSMPYLSNFTGRASAGWLKLLPSGSFVDVLRGHYVSSRVLWAERAERAESSVDKLLPHDQATCVSCR